MLGAIGLFVALNAQQAAQLKDPSAVISEVFKKYYYAETLSGTIVSETTDGAGVKKVTTSLTYARPTKILVQQDTKGRNGLPYKLVSDGNTFSYDVPYGSLVRPKPGERLFEKVTIRREGTNDVLVQDVGMVYAAAHKSLMPSTLLDLAIAHRDHLSDFRINVRDVVLVGVVDLAGKQAYYMKGQWQPYRGSPEAIGAFELWVSTAFDLLKFRLSQPYLVNNRRVVAVTTETADLAVGAKVSDAVFVVK